MNLILCGLPGCGKTTIGQLAAKELGYAFIDTDRQLEALYASQNDKPMTCRQIALQEGAMRFREWEDKVIVSLVNARSSVIATGGGTLTRPKNVDLLRGMGTMIYLKGSPHILLKRILKHGMPSYLDAANPLTSFETLAQSRVHIYEAACHVTIDIQELHPSEILSMLCKRMYVNLPR